MTSIFLVALVVSLHVQESEKRIQIVQPNLVQDLESDDANTRLTAVKLLGTMRANKFSPRVARMLEDKNASVRAAAVESLCLMNAKEFTPQIAKRLQDTDPEVCALSVNALLEFGANDSKHITQIAKLLSDKRAYPKTVVEFERNSVITKTFQATVRASAAEALGNLEAKDFAPQIARLLEDRDQRVSSAATGALVQLGARDQVTRLLGHQDPHVRDAAKEALKRLDEKKKD